MLYGFYRYAIVASFMAAIFTAGANAESSLDVPPPGFSSLQVDASKTSVHIVRGGHGPALILLHGFPETWIAYRTVMQHLAGRFTVVAVDLPGIGKSGPNAAGYSAIDIASTIHAVAVSLKLGRHFIVGHDLGGIVTYTYVRRYPESLRGAMILDAPIPGLPGWSEAMSGVWHVGFIQAPSELAEKLVVGRQAPFLDWFYNIGTIAPLERAYYIRSYGGPQLHAAFEMYREFPKDVQWNESQSTKNSVPLIFAVGAKSFMYQLLPTFVKGLRAKGMTHVEIASVPNSVHYVLDDNPTAVVDLIQRLGQSGSI